MKDLFKALKHCYCEEGNCNGCPYEKQLNKCNQLFKNIETVFNKIGEYVDFEDIENIVKIIVKKGDKNNESKD